MISYSNRGSALLIVLVAIFQYIKILSALIMLGLLFSGQAWTRDPGSSDVFKSTGSGFELTNTALKVDQDRWTWVAYISASSEDLHRIKCVTYFLHPSFPNAVRRTCDGKDDLYPFSVTETSWDTFVLRAKIELRDNSAEILDHELDFTASNVSVEDNQDRPGSDLSNYSVPTVISCQKLCLHDSVCDTYTFIPLYSSPLNYSGPPLPRCFLKSGHPISKLYKGAISGIAR